ncbi:DUF6056 family protein [Paenibacillus sp. VTT E-133291]|uniref:DUF6056 family protein n=1 Tax=unclassified Paenibacillus TaxID=185978 RepID=UPI000BA007EA|nr:hypothetical protein CA598_11005 [Paenibacillus sp. VTT E-133291]
MLNIFRNKNTYFFFFCYIILYTYHNFMSLTVGDDMYFSTVEFPFFDWIRLRYETWSGRLFPDTLAFMLFKNHYEVWQLLNPLFIMLSSYAIVRIVIKDFRIRDLLISLLILGYFSKNVLSSAFFWGTGSVNYLWPIALGLLAMIPYADKLFRDEQPFSMKHFAITVICASLASISNEQVALCMIAFSILLHISLILKRKPQDIKLLIITVIMILGTCILLLAPGNHSRYVNEVATWFPGFDKLSIKDHLYIGIIWIFQKLFVDLKYLIMLLSIIVFIACYRDSNFNRKYSYKIFGVLIFIIFSNMVLGYNTEIFYNFEAIKQYNLFHSIFHIFGTDKGFLYALIPYVFWTIFTALLCVLIIKLSQQKIFIFLALSAAAFSLVVMFFSPTIYASGNRVLAVSSIILTLITAKLILDRQLITTKYHLVLLGCLPVLNLLQFLISWLSNGFHIMY